MHLLPESKPFMSLESCIAHWFWFLRRTNNLTMFVIVNWRQVSWRTLPCQGGVGVTQPLYWLKSLPNVLSWRKNWMYHRKMAHWNVSCNKSLGFLILIIIAQPLHVCFVFLEVCWLYWDVWRFEAELREFWYVFISLFKSGLLSLQTKSSMYSSRVMQFALLSLLLIPTGTLP